MASVIARLTLGAVLHRHHRLLQEGPVVLRRKELAQPGKERVDQFLFFLRRFGNGDVDHHRVVQTNQALRLFGQRLDEGILFDRVERRRQRNLILRRHVGDRTVPLGYILDRQFFHFSKLSVARSTQSFLPWPSMWDAAQVTFWASTSWICAS